MNSYEQMMCELQAELFEKSIDSFICGSAFFVARFMNSDIAKELDNVDDPYNYISPNNTIKILNELYPSLNTIEGEKHSRAFMRWAGYIYRAWCLIKKTTSSKIYKDVKIETLLSLYDSFHSFSVEYCIDRIEELIFESKPKRKTDFEIYKEIKRKSKTRKTI